MASLAKFDGGVLASRILPIVLGEYIVLGQDVSITTDYVIPISTGSYLITGSSIVDLPGAVTDKISTALVLVADDVNMSKSYMIVGPETGVFR